MTRVRRQKTPGIPSARWHFRRVMKKHLMFATGLLGLTVSAGALDIPRSVHRASDAAKATEEATQSKKGVLWVLSDSTLKPT